MYRDLLQMVVIYGKINIPMAVIDATTPNVKQAKHHPTYEYPDSDIAVVEVCMYYFYIKCNSTQNLNML